MTELIVEMFEKKQRERIIKITPNGKLETIITQEELRDKINSDRNEDYEYISEKLKEFYNDKNKLSYIKASIDAINDKESLNRLKVIIRGIELTQ